MKYPILGQLPKRISHVDNTSSVIAPNDLACVSPLDTYRLVCELWPTVTNLFPNATTRPQSIGPALCAGLICVINGFRISEVLALKISDIMNGATVFVHAKKNGVPRFFHLPNNIINEAVLMNLSKSSKLFPVSYASVKRAFEANNLFALFDGYCVRRITHLGRHMLASGAVASGHGADVGALLGHKSTKASEWYKKEVDLNKDKLRKRRERAKK